MTMSKKTNTIKSTERCMTKNLEEKSLEPGQGRYIISGASA